MLKLLPLISKLLDLILLIVTAVKNKRLRNEGRNEILEEIRLRNEEQARDAERTREDIAGADLADLEQRMRKYQRDTED